MILDGVSAVKFLVSGKPQLVGTILKAHFAFWGSLSASLAKRKAVKAMGSHRAPLYKRSIVWQHFAKKKNTFSELP
jgi:hypothetical protein